MAQVRQRERKNPKEGGPSIELEYCWSNLKQSPTSVRPVVCPSVCGYLGEGDGGSALEQRHDFLTGISLTVAHSVRYERAALVTVNM